MKPRTAYKIYRVTDDGEKLVSQSYSNGNQIKTIDTFITDESGEIITVKPLRSAKYRIYEVDSANGLHIVKKFIEVVINSKADNYESYVDEDGYTHAIITVTYTNEETYGKLAISKNGQMLMGWNSEKREFIYEDRSLKGAEFEIYADGDIVTQDNQGDTWFKDGEKVATITTGEKAEFTWENGQDEFVLNSTEGTDKSGSLNLRNELARPQISLIKEDADTKETVSGTGIGYDCDGNSSEQFNKLWPADLHLIGKDIIRFHTIYWPIFLMALGEPLPKQVFGHPWLLMNNDKMSKSKGNVIYADDLVDFFGVDAVRYYVLHEMPFDNDGNITWELVTERTNAELANTLGNLVNRTISMSNKYFGGIVADKKVTGEMDEDLKAVVTGTYKRVSAKMDELRVADAITEIFALFKRCNKYIDETEPWVLAKDEANMDRLSTVLYNLVESIATGASLLEPFMPATAKKIVQQLNTSVRSFEDCEKFGLYESGNKVTAEPEILFARLKVEEVMEKVNAMYAERKAQAAGENGEAVEENVIDIEPKEEITFDDFAKMQFQIGEIIKCEEVPKSKKLLCSQVRVGSQIKQIVSGIKQHYSAEEMVGKKVMVLVNLKPAKLAGVLSEGMLLCAEDAEGRPSVRGFAPAAQITARADTGPSSVSRRNVPSVFRSILCTLLKVSSAPAASA